MKQIIDVDWIFIDEKIIYEKYEELYKLLNDCIKNVAPDQDKGQNLVN